MLHTKCALPHFLPCRHGFKDKESLSLFSPIQSWNHGRRVIVLLNTVHFSEIGQKCSIEISNSSQTTDFSLFGSTIWPAEERKQCCLYSHPRIESIFIRDLSVSATQAPSRSLAAAMHALRIRRIEEKSLFSWYLYLDVSILMVYSAIVCTVKLSTSHSRLVTATHTHTLTRKKKRNEL